MAHRRPDLIVPIHDRRQGRRILTLRNTGFVLLAMIVLFFAITIRSERRHGSADGDYGRLYHRELPPPLAQQPQAVDIIEESTPIADNAAADPMLTAPAARAQFLETETTNASAVAAQPQLTLDAPRSGNARVAIVGGPAGVAMIDNAPQREKKLLKGGVFRNQ